MSKRYSLTKVFGKGFEIVRTNYGFLICIEYQDEIFHEIEFTEKMSDKAKDAKERAFDLYHRLIERN